MNQSFYIGAIGAHQQLQKMTVQGNNIANLNTYGFKATKGRFAALMYQDPLRSIDGEEVDYGAGTALWQTDTDYSSGPLASTGRDQDYAIIGDGFFAVADLQTGEVSYTRNGAFVMSELLRPTGEVDEEGNTAVDENGQPLQEKIYYLSDNEGRFVLSDTGGMIEITDPHAELPVGVFDYINYQGMQHMNDTRFQPVDKNGGLRRGEGTAVQGMLEMSNADLANEFSKVIEAQRAYQMALRMVTTSDEIESTINGLRS